MMRNNKRLYIVIGAVALVLIVMLIIINPFQSEAGKAKSFFEGKNKQEHAQPELMLSDDKYMVSTPAMLQELHKLYNMQNITDFVLYHDKTKVQAEFYFTEDVTPSELEIAVRVGFEKMHMGMPNMIVDSAFDGWIITAMNENIEFEQTDIILYIDDELLLYHHYENMLLTQKYENVAMTLAARVDADINDYINTYVITAMDGKQASGQRSLMGNAVLLQISGEQLLTKKEYEELISFIKSNNTIHAIAPGRSHVVLVLLDDTGNIYSEDVFESSENGLSDEDVDWMTLKPY